MNNDALTSRVAMMAFLSAFRREWARRNPNEPYCPVPAWASIAPEDQRTFTKCMAIALKATDPVNVARVLYEEAERR